MESSHRNVLIVLALLLAIGLGTILWGAKRQSPAPNGTDPKQRAASLELKPKWAAWGERLRSLGPKVELEREVVDVPPAFPPRPVTVDVVAEPGTPYRTARFRLAAGAGRIVYDDRTPDATDDLRRQSIAFPAPASEQSRQGDPMAGSVVVLESGGTLSFFCAARQACRFSLE